MIVFRKPFVFLDSTMGKVCPSEIKKWKKEGFELIVFLGSQASNIEKGILPITELPGLNADSVAQWLDAQLVAWAYQCDPPVELAFKNALIIGYGAVGGALSGILRGRKMDVTPFDKDFAWCNNEKLCEYLKKADFIFVCLPFSNETKGFFNGLAHCFKQKHVLFSISRPEVMKEYPWNFVSDSKHQAWLTSEVMERKKRITEEYGLEKEGLKT